MPVSRLIKNELEMISDEGTVTNFKELSRNLQGKPRESLVRTAGFSAEI